MAKYWLLKTEPGSYSIDDLKSDGHTTWEGVRNYQARNFIRDDMKVGDGVLFYHSNANPPGVAGLARISRAAHPDPTARDAQSHYYDPKSTDEDPRWFMVEIEFVDRFDELIPLSTIRDAPGLEDMLLNKKSRLSVQPVTEAEFELVQGMGKS